MCLECPRLLCNGKKLSCVCLDMKTDEISRLHGIPLGKFSGSLDAVNKAANTLKIAFFGLFHATL